MRKLILRYLRSAHAQPNLRSEHALFSRAMLKPFCCVKVNIASSDKNFVLGMRIVPDKEV